MKFLEINCRLSISKFSLNESNEYCFWISKGFDTNKIPLKFHSWAPILICPFVKIFQSLAVKLLS